MGDFWHGPEVAGLSNLWYANYADADKQLQVDPHLYSLPCRRQFMLVSTHYLQAPALQRLQTSRVGRFAQ